MAGAVTPVSSDVEDDCNRVVGWWNQRASPGCRSTVRLVVDQAVAWRTTIPTTAIVNTKQRACAGLLAETAAIASQYMNMLL